MLLQVYNVGLVGSNFRSDCLGKILHILHLDSTNVILLAIWPVGAVGGGHIQNLAEPVLFVSLCQLLSGELSTEVCSVKRKSVKKREVTRKQSKITRGKGLFLF